MKSTLTIALTSLCLPSIAGILTNAPSLVDERQYPLNLPDAEEVSPIVSETFGITDPMSGLLFSYRTSVSSDTGPLTITNFGVFCATFTAVDITGLPVSALISITDNGTNLLIKSGYVCITHPCILQVESPDNYIEVKNISWAYPAPTLSVSYTNLTLSAHSGQKANLWSSTNLIKWTKTPLLFTNNFIDVTPKQNTFYRSE